MLNIVYILPGFLIIIVALNRYFFGKFLWDSKAFVCSKIKNPWRPRVSVVIPVYNEGPSIYETIKSIANSSYPKNLLDIWVVDDCSQDDSLTWVNKAAQEFSGVHIIRNSHNIGKRQGIANAVRQLSGEIVISVDSDVLVSHYAIEILIGEFTSSKVAAAGGRVAVSNANENTLTRMQAIKYWVGYEFLKNLENAFETVMCLSGCLTAYRRTVLLEVEPILHNRSLLGMPIKYGEDRFLTRQIVKRGYKTKLNLNALCFTKAPPTLAGYFSQQLRWRRSNIVDFLGGITHIWNQHPLVVLLYLCIRLCFVTLWCCGWRPSDKTSQLGCCYIYRFLEYLASCIAFLTSLG